MTAPEPDDPALPAVDEAVPPCYPGAPDSLIDRWNIRRQPLSFARREALPALDTDLKALLAARVPDGEVLPRRASGHAAKRHEIRKELTGFTELAALNGLLISHLRKSGYPRVTPRLFRRIWTEEGPALLAELPPRWLISSVITFGEHGSTEEQRRIGLSINMLFSLMKLYEFERLYSGATADKPFTLRRTTDKRLPLDMPQFSLLSGGLDINLLAQIWQMSLDEPVAGPLACHLLQLLNDDPASLFRRIGLMREALRDKRATRAERRPAPPPAEAAE